MAIRAEEITSIIEQELTGFDSSLDVEKVGTILRVGDSIATVYGLNEAMAGELLEFPGGMKGVVLNLEEASVGVALFGSDRDIKEGDVVRRTGRMVYAQEAPGFTSLGSEVAATVMEKAFYALEAPVLRVSGFDLPFPPAKLEGAFLPDADRILEAVDRALAY